jgi:hypothetical protein
MEGVSVRNGRLSANFDRLRRWFDVDGIGRLDTKIGTPIQRLFGRGVVAVSATLPENIHLLTGNTRLELGKSQADLRFLIENHLLGVFELKNEESAFKQQVREQLIDVRNGDLVDGNIHTIIPDPTLRKWFNEVAIEVFGIDTGTIAKFGPGEKIVFSPDGSRIAYVRRPNDFGCQMGRPIGLGVYIIATGEDTLPFPFKDCKKEVTKIPVGTIIRGYPIRL